MLIKAMKLQITQKLDFADVTGSSGGPNAKHQLKYLK